MRDWHVAQRVPEAASVPLLSPLFWFASLNPLANRVQRLAMPDFANSLDCRPHFSLRGVLVSLGPADAAINPLCLQRE
jgi:hypothetical protein